MTGARVRRVDRFMDRPPDYPSAADAGPGAGQVTSGFQVSDDGLDGPVGQSDDGADVPDPGSRVAGDLHEDVSVPGQERPDAAAIVRIAHAS